MKFGFGFWRSSWDSVDSKGSLKRLWNFLRTLLRLFMALWTLLKRSLRHLRGSFRLFRFLFSLVETHLFWTFQRLSWGSCSPLCGADYGHAVRGLALSFALRLIWCIVQVGPLWMPSDNIALKCTNNQVFFCASTIPRHRSSESNPISSIAHKNTCSNKTNTQVTMYLYSHISPSLSMLGDKLYTHTR